MHPLLFATTGPESHRSDDPCDRVGHGADSEPMSFRNVRICWLTVALLRCSCRSIAHNKPLYAVGMERTSHLNRSRMRDAARVEKLFRGLSPTDRGCALTITGGMNRPPMERSRGTVALFRKAEELAHAMGFALEEASTGGGSDGNFAAALGIPTLDGMGAVGEGAHAAHESIVLSELAKRTALLAAMIGNHQKLS